MVGTLSLPGERWGVVTQLPYLLSLDKLHTALSELSFSINYVSSMPVWEHSFTPREYLTAHLEIRFTK